MLHDNYQLLIHYYSISISLSPNPEEKVSEMEDLEVY